MIRSVLKRASQVVAIATICIGSVGVASAQTVEEEFARENKLVEAIKVYNDQLADQIAGQGVAETEIRDSIVQSGSLAPQVADLLGKMLSALETFISADLPFHMDTRLSSVGQLKSLMVDPAASMSDRFRNIMDIYTIETEYGNTYEAYADTITIEGSDVEVDMLRVGRLALYYQTKDGNVSGMWDRASGSFVILPDTNNRYIRTAIRVAAKLVAPELLNIPTPAPEGV
ncbi:MAG TPA: hypothetical protein DCY55_09120 [Gammaproteobacteria bacterium]|jgi:hypothetical protein|nr:hypothetical protein [Gammaproteobacteria bacterium]